MTEKKILLITGAGASFDCIDEDRTGLPIDNRYQPPLTINLFQPPIPITGIPHGEGEVIQRILAKHTIAAKVGYKLGMIDRSEIGLEERLNSIKCSQKLAIANQFWSVPLYLCELFQEISDKYLGSKKGIATNYSLLLDALIENGYTQLVWLNLNYDLFGDRAIIGITGGLNFKNMSDYLNRKTIDGMSIKYTKPHGSINWVREIKDTEFGVSHIKEQQISKNIADAIGEEVYLNFEAKNRKIHEVFQYPAITAPTGTYDNFVFEDHREQLSTAIKDIHKVLMIGFNALDQDILNFMKANLHLINDLKIVNGDFDSGRRSLQYLLDSGISTTPVIKIDPNDSIYDGGFSKFVNEGMNLWLRS